MVYCFLWLLEHDPMLPLVFHSRVHSFSHGFYSISYAVLAFLSHFSPMQLKPKQGTQAAVRAARDVREAAPRAVRKGFLAPGALRAPWAALARLRLLLLEEARVAGDQVPTARHSIHLSLYTCRYRYRMRYMYIWSRPPAGYPPPPHGMVQLGVARDVACLYCPIIRLCAFQVCLRSRTKSSSLQIP